MEGGRACHTLAPVDGNYDDSFFSCGMGESEGDEPANPEVGREVGREGGREEELDKTQNTYTLTFPHALPPLHPSLPPSLSLSPSCPPAVEARILSWWYCPKEGGREDVSGEEEEKEVVFLARESLRSHPSRPLPLLHLAWRLMVNGHVIPQALQLLTQATEAGVSPSLPPSLPPSLSPSFTSPGG